MKKLIEQMASTGALSKATARYKIDLAITNGTITVDVFDSQNRMKLVYAKIIHIVPFDREGTKAELKAAMVAMEHYHNLNNQEQAA